MAEVREIWLFEGRVNDLRYAHDICLLAHNYSDLVLKRYNISKAKL